MAYSYAFNGKGNYARAVGVSMPVSHKKAILVCNFIRHKAVGKAKLLLQDVIAQKRAVPYTRFNDGVGHRKGMNAGRYPIDTCKHILALLESAESNAQFKGLSTGNLVVVHTCAQRGPTTWHYGRHRRREAKRAHVEIVLEEKKGSEKESKKVKKAVRPVKQEVKA
jgi:large subunit ribosomal protein L22